MNDTEGTTIVELGTGVLTWPRDERVSDRYGTVMLTTDPGTWDTEPAGYVNPTDPPIGQRGTLVAEVIATRASDHIGDIFRGFSPETPDVGERIELGSGTFFTEPTDFGAVLMGLSPDDARKSDWLDPKALYRAHNQTVRLVFVPATDAPADGA
jgi:hypothetical protein